VRQQTWELTHIFVWAVSGGLLTLVLVLCALIFACTHCWCVARRPSVCRSTGRIDPSLNTRSKFIGICLFINLVLLVAIAATTIVFDVRMRSDVDTINTYVNNEVEELSQVLDSNFTCTLMSDYPEAGAIQQRCIQVQNSLFDFTNHASDTNRGFDNFFHQFIYCLFVITGILVFLSTIAVIGACCRIGGLVRFFTFFTLFFAAIYVALWMGLGLPGSLTHHSCKLIHESFVKNDSNVFPGMPIIALAYNLSDGFQNFGPEFTNDFNYDLNNINQVDFDALSQDQEEVFQMIRSCLWEGVTLNTTLDAMNMRTTMESQLGLMRQVHKRLELNLLQYGLSLPSNFSHELNSIKWGHHNNDTQSKKTLQTMQNQIITLKIQIGDREAQGGMTRKAYKNLTGDADLISIQADSLSEFITLTDCEHYKDFYGNMNQKFCDWFVYDMQTLAWQFAFVAAFIVLLFFISFCAGYRIFSRLDAHRRLLLDEEQQQARGNVNRSSAPRKTSSDLEPLLSDFDQKLNKPGYTYYGTAPVTYNPAPPPFNPNTNTSS